MTSLFRVTAPLALAVLTIGSAAAQEPKVNPGTERESPAITLQGTLVDAGCRDRTARNLGLPAATFNSEKPAENAAAQQAAQQMRSNQGGMANPNGQQQGSVSASGVTIDPKTLANERPDVLEHQVADLRSRQLDPSCAITGATHNFALYLPDGRFLSLDEAGATYANEAVLGSAQGRDMLAGNGGGFKPQVVIKGNMRAEKVLVQSIKIAK